MAAPAHTLVVADGDVDLRLLTELTAERDGVWIIAADGGAARLLRAGLTPDVVVGDFDSLSAADGARLEALGVELRRADPDKDESDMELCLLAALEAGAARITVLGALGLVRPEHGVANLLLLADARVDEVDITIAGRGSRLTRIGTVAGPGQTVISGAAGDFVSLFPLESVVEGVTTAGLHFALADEVLPMGPSRGLSNELLAEQATVSTRRGRLLVIHTDRSMANASATGED
jgi:thiamine pyrophosphokinase